MYSTALSKKRWTNLKLPESVVDESSESFGSSARCCDVCHPHAQAFLPQTQVSLSNSEKRKCDRAY